MTISHSTNGGGSSFRLVHVSDTHLSRTHGYFHVNRSAFRQAMAASPPDMLIHGGDISFNGPAAPLDLAYAAEEIAALGLPWRAIPGNHVWAPATAMVDVKHPLAKRGSFPRPGYLEWTLRPDGASHALVEPERMFVIDMTGWTKHNGGTTTTLPAWP